MSFFLDPKAHPRGFPLVSVLLPVFDAVRTLPACLRSIQRQTFEGWECVIVDDGSLDGSALVAREAARRDPRFRVVETAHRGLVAALDRGLAECRGDWVARMDGDDLMHRERLAAQVRALQARAELAGVGTHVRLFPRRDLGEGNRAYERWLNRIDSPERLRAEAFVECPIAHPSLMIRRSTLTKFGYRDRGWPEDYDLVLRLLEAGEVLGVVPERLLAWRHHGKRLSRTHASYAIERFTACKAEFLARGFLAQSDAYVLWGYGETGKALRRALLEHGKRPRWIVELHPGRVGETIHGSPVIRPEGLGEIPRMPVVVSVAGAPARLEIRAALAAMSFRELDDYVLAA